MKFVGLYAGRLKFSRQRFSRPNSFDNFKQILTMKLALRGATARRGCFGVLRSKGCSALLYSGKARRWSERLPSPSEAALLWQGPERNVATEVGDGVVAQSGR
jgi:hypothetical protein